MNEEDKDKWIELCVNMETSTLIGFIITVLEENFSEEQIEICYKQELEHLEFFNSASKDMSENGLKNKNQWLLKAKMLGVEI